MRKRVWSMLLVLVMAMGLWVPVSAADEPAMGSPAVQEEITSSPEETQDATAAPMESADPEPTPVEGMDVPGMSDSAVADPVEPETSEEPEATAGPEETSEPESPPEEGVSNSDHNPELDVVDEPEEAADNVVATGSVNRSNGHPSYTWTVTADGTLTFANTENNMVLALQDEPKPWLSYADVITHVVISTGRDSEDGVDSVDLAYGLVGLYRMERVDYPASIEKLYVEQGSFQGCSSMKSLRIPKLFKVDEMWYTVFGDCTSLTNFVVEEGNETWADMDPLSLIAIDGVLYADDGAMLVYCPPGLSGKFTIPSHVKAIGYGAFAADTAITEVIIPDSVTELGANAFMGCTGLTSIVIPDSITEISDRAFQLTNLQSVTLPQTLTYIGSGAFEDVGKVIIPESVGSIGRLAFLHVDEMTILNPTCKLADPAFGTIKLLKGYQFSTAWVYHYLHDSRSLYPIGGEWEDLPSGYDPYSDGWRREHYEWYYYVDGEPVKNTWVMSARGIWYFMDEDGIMVTGVHYCPALKGYYNEKTGTRDTKTAWPGGLYFFEIDGFAPGRVRGSVPGTDHTWFRDPEYGDVWAHGQHDGYYGMVEWTTKTKDVDWKK